jgi:hypothetical protein
MCSSAKAPHPAIWKIQYFDNDTRLINDKDTFYFRQVAGLNRPMGRKRVQVAWKASYRKITPPPKQFQKPCAAVASGCLARRPTNPAPVCCTVKQPCVSCFLICYFALLNPLPMHLPPGDLLKTIDSPDDLKKFQRKSCTRYVTNCASILSMW